MKDMLDSAFLRKALFKLRGGVLTLKPTGHSRGRVLFSHDTTPFLNPRHPLDAHANYWTAVEMVRIFRERGYTVDVIDNRNQRFIPRHQYTYFVDLEQNMDRLTPHLNPECIRILHIVASHWLFQNTAELSRLQDLTTRRGVVIFPNRGTRPTHSIENADCATMIGNDFTESTYAFAGKKIYRTPLPPNALFPFPEDKNFDASRKNFIWFGGAGAVHKGLDLVIEAFVGMPEFNLTIFGKSTADHEFLDIYHKELTETSNIRVLGYLDFKSDEFQRIRRESIGLVYPSCSEGTAGAAVMSMHAGILPIISVESGADIAHSGIVLRENTIPAIQEAVRHIASLSAEELRQRAKRGWDHARSYYTQEQYRERYSAFVDALESGAHKRD